MTEYKELSDLVLYSHKIGDNKAYIQGGGGNTSIKLDDQWMAIKASGRSLMEMSPSDGFCLVDYDQTRAYLESPDSDDSQFTKAIQSFTKGSDSRPSMETGFHAIGKKSVIHTHSVYVNLLTCSKEGPRIAKELFPSSIWINYETPGRDITLRIKQVLDREIPSVIFLENHGVIISDEQMKEAYDIHEDVNKKIQTKLNLAQYPFEVARSCVDIEVMKEKVFFPDQVVYTLAGQEILKTPAALETLAAYDYIFNMVKHLNLTPQFISAEKSQVLLNMESEKYRQSLIKK